MGTSIRNTIKTFSNTPHPSVPNETTPRRTHQRLPPPPPSHWICTIRLSDFFSKCTANVKRCIETLSASITDPHTKLRLFSMCLLQKISHLLSSDIMYHRPHDEPNLRPGNTGMNHLQEQPTTSSPPSSPRYSTHTTTSLIMQHTLPSCPSQLEDSDSHAHNYAPRSTLSSP